MIWKPINMLSFSTETKKWSEKKWDDFNEFYSYLLDQKKTPGEYNLVNTEYWRAPAITFQTTGKYTDFHPKSPDYKDFWLFERRKIKQGFIIDNFFIPGDFYFFLNYTPIPNKVENKPTFPDLYDGHYDVYLYLELCWYNNEDAAICKARQKGMEQPNSELVLSEHGWVEMGSIKKGDKVYTPKGHLTTVLDVFPQGKKDVYEMSLIDGRTVRCGENHLWPVYNEKTKNRKKIHILSTKELLEKGLHFSSTATTLREGKKEYKSSKFSLPETDPMQFPKKDLKIHPYVLGALLGDGSLGKDSVSLTSADPEMFEYMLEYLGDKYYLGNKDQAEGNNSYRHSFRYKDRFNEDNENFHNHKYGVNPLKRYIQDYGLDGTTCYNKFIPKDYLFSDFEDRLLLLQGICDTDGYINEKGADIHVTTTSPQLAQDVAHLARSLGISSVIASFPPAKVTDAPFFRVRLKPRFSLFKLKRKLERQFGTTRGYIKKYSILDIKKLDYQEESTCIYVEDEDHQYITKDFIPTHNSLVHTERLIKRLWFEKGANLKILGFEESYVLGEWGLCEMYKNHLNEHTGFYREFNPDATLHWQQRSMVTEGVVEKKTIYKGNNSKLTGATTKKNISKAVGGSALEIYCTEAGIYPNLKKVLEYGSPNLKLGGVKTGMFCMTGAVGELKDAADFQDISFNPRAYGVRPVKDIFSGSGDDIAYFFPTYWNYVYEDPDTRMFIKCFDKHGNSDIEMAKKYLEIEREKAKKKDESTYKLWLSQNASTLQDAFDQREDNPFPTSLLKKREQDLISLKDIIVRLERNEQGKVIHKFSDDVPIQTLHPKPDADNRGAVVLWEFPKPNPPIGLYYAGVDPIKNFDTSTSSSLMSITVYMADHERDGKICQGYPVATYTGRHKRVSETYQVCLNLIEYYNALTAVESNVADFTEWMIKERKAKYLMRRSQITVINEMMPQSTIRDEIGVRMEGHFKQRCIEKLIRYLEEPMSDVFDLETGENYTKHGVDKIRDKMFIKELLRWTSKLNTDRLVSNILAIMAAESSTNRHMLQEVKRGDHKSNTKANYVLPSAFTAKSRQGMSKMPSPFKRLK